MCQKSKVTIKCAVCTCIGILSHLGGTAISQRWNYALTRVKYLIIDVFSVRKALGLPSKKPKIASGGSGQIPNFFVILCP